MCIMYLFPLNLCMWTFQYYSNVVSSSLVSLLTLLPLDAAARVMSSLAAPVTSSSDPLLGWTHGAGPAGAGGMTFTSSLQPTFTIEMTRDITPTIFWEDTA